MIMNLTPSLALARSRDDIRRIVLSHRATNPRVFGSVLHGEDTADSDLDLLVDPLPGTTLFDLGGIQVELEALLGVPVDVLTPGDLPRKFRDRVLQEAMPV
jgi:predicted nucleotidyltransferase